MSSSARRFALVALAAALLVAALPSAALAQGDPPAERPNVAVVMTDDQDMRSLAVMDNVQRRLAARGTTFENFFATYPLCCPSRATFLTGQYAHNHGVQDNNPPSGGFAAFRDSSTLATDLRQAGYTTGLFGKYMNGYPQLEGTDQQYVPPGWTDWHAAIGGLYYDLELNENGRLRGYGNDPRNYSTDVLARKAERFIGAASHGPQPFFLVFTPYAPHVVPVGEPPLPAPRHTAAFDGRPLPRPPSFNEKDVADKPSFVRDRAPLGEQEIDHLRAVHEGRLESLLAVDEAVDRLLDRLEQEGELQDTLVIYTSDNGFLQGEHRLRNKGVFYEESARVPMIIRGPGVPTGSTRPQLTGNIDLAPTLLDAADVEPLRTMDGSSLLPLARDPGIAWRKGILLENATSVALRTRRYMYAEHPEGERELYDLKADPFQLQSLHSDSSQGGVIESLSGRLADIRDCGGTGCP